MIGMPKKRNVQPLVLMVLAIMAAHSLQSQDINAPPSHVFFRVQAAPSLQAPLNGRLLIFVAKGKGDKAVDIDQFHPDAVWVAAKEVRDLAAGESIEVDADEAAFPKPFANMPPGDYETQAVLDTGHRYAYNGRRPSRLDQQREFPRTLDAGTSAPSPCWCSMVIRRRTHSAPP